MSVILKTQRLLLRNLEKSDASSVFSWRNDPLCAKYQRWEDTTAVQIEAFISRHLEDVFLSEKEEQHYIITAISGEAVGELAYFFTPSDCITLGITVSMPHQRSGYAFELLGSVIAKIRCVYPSMDIVALIDPENTASIRLFQNLGFTLECYAASIDSCVYTLPGTRQA